MTPKPGSLSLEPTLAVHIASKEWFGVMMGLFSRVDTETCYRTPVILKTLGTSGHARFLASTLIAVDD